MAEKPNDPWSYGVTADDGDPPRDPEDVVPEADDTARHHTGRWTSPSLGSYDPSVEHEALSDGNGADDAYFRDFGYGEGFGDGRLAAGYDAEPSPSPAAAPGPDPAIASEIRSDATRPQPSLPPRSNGADPAGRNGNDLTGPDGRIRSGSADGPGATGPYDPWSPSTPGEDGRRTRSATESGSDDRPGPLDDPANDPDVDEVGSASGGTRNLIEWAVVLVGAVLLALVLRALVLQAFWIPSPSMESTLLVRDRVLVNKVSYRVGDIDRGHVIVFRRTDEEIAQNPELPRDVIKRVIALGGESIEIIDNEVFIDGSLLREPYLDDGVTTTNFGPETVPDGHIFVMGDNRELSLDSRFETGPVAEDRVVGRAFFLFWPLNRLGSL